MRRLVAAIFLITAPWGAVFAQFDHSHAAWTALLKKHVVVIDWFKEDWQSGYRGFDGRTPPIGSREQYFGRYAKLLADDPVQQKLIEDGKVPIVFLDYDWTLNDAKR